MHECQNKDKNVGSGAPFFPNHIASIVFSGHRCFAFVKRQSCRDATFTMKHFFLPGCVQNHSVMIINFNYGTAIMELTAHPGCIKKSFFSFG